MNQENQDPIAPPVPWNKGKLIGQKLPLKLKEIRVIRIRLPDGQKFTRISVIQLRHRQ